MLGKFINMSKSIFPASRYELNVQTLNWNNVFWNDISIFQFREDFPTPVTR